TAKITDLVPADAPIEKHRSRSVQSSLSNQDGQTLTQLDIRGMTMSDGVRMVEEFLDKAMLSNVHELTIIHGVGSGVLRKETKRICREYRDIKEFFHPPYEAGGDGVTIIKL
ncbi:Smr/MutS family protein, partial [Saprospiraceae bacterium]|nr:Smr/MutS family protein [Saprospiraceae bacterium]